MIGRKRYLWNEELSDREIFLIGKIVAQWGALEHEVFVQTLNTFNAPDAQDALPKEMNNLQFTGVLNLWKARVVDQAPDERRKELEEVYENIVHYKDYRDALVHSMWEWTPQDLEKITATRIRKKEIIQTIFTADDLEHFYLKVASLNFTLKVPNGPEGLAKSLEESGGYMSRRFLSQITGSPKSKEWGSLVAGPTSDKDKDA